MNFHRKALSISKKLHSYQLKKIDENELIFDDDIFSSNTNDRSSMLFLGYYSKTGIKQALEKYGVFDILAKKGFDNFKICMDTNDSSRQRLAVYSNENLLGEIVLGMKNIILNLNFKTKYNGLKFDILAIEWMCLQNIKKEFTKERPCLPGQKYGGLEIGEFIMELIIIMCKRLKQSGLLNMPEYFHNAYMYSMYFRYIDPEYEGKLKAIARDLFKKYTLAQVSWAIDLRCVYENNKPFDWFISKQIIPVNKNLKNYFSSFQYKNLTKKSFVNNSYTLDIEYLKSKNIPNLFS